MNEHKNRRIRTRVNIFFFATSVTVLRVLYRHFHRWVVVERVVDFTFLSSDYFIGLIDLPNFLFGFSRLVCIIFLNNNRRAKGSFYLRDTVSPSFVSNLAYVEFLSTLTSFTLFCFREADLAKIFSLSENSFSVLRNLAGTLCKRMFDWSSSETKSKMLSSCVLTMRNFSLMFAKTVCPVLNDSFPTKGTTRD